jgi:hypothetical protein
MAVQPSATTALVMQSDAISLAGTVHDPPREYLALDCPVRTRPKWQRSRWLYSVSARSASTSAAARIEARSRPEVSAALSGVAGEVGPGEA